MSAGALTSPKLLDRVLRETAINLTGCYEKKAEDRRVRWTTYANLRLWFDNWKREVIELGFAKESAEGEVIFPQDQLERIINLDETCLSLDGSDGARGGRPNVAYINQTLPQLGKSSAKSNITTTLITGSSAAGEALPPHFQFSTKAKSVDTMKMRRETVIYMHDVRGKFGNEENKIWPVTLGMNEKGGMDDDEFEKYIHTSIVPLYPDVSNTKGKRVLIKIDSGPGRTNPDLLASLRTMGTLTVPHSQERVEAIMHCKTHGQSFMATGGMPITADETFLAAEQEKKKNEIRNIQVDKLKRMEAEKREAAAFKIIEKEIQTKDLKVENLNVLLAWHQVKLTGMSKAQKLSKWKTIKETNKPPPTYQKWTEEDERKLNEKKDKTIELGDTALGRFQDRKRKEMEESFKSATKEEQEEMLKKLKAIVDE